MSPSGQHHDSFDSLSPDEMIIVNDACDRFEKQWRDSEHASIKDFVPQLGLQRGRVADVILVELIAMDASYRRKFRVDFTLASYQGWFPEIDREILAKVVDHQRAQTESIEDFNDDTIDDSTGQPSIEIGQRIGDYRIEQCIGQGGMGKVFQATHELMSRTVAVKVMSESSHSDSTASKRFQREIQSLAGMRHRNIVSALDARFENGRLWLVTEWIDGSDLNEHVRQHGVMTASDVIDVAKQAAAGLHHAHQQGFVHRDVKPGNLMLDSKGSIKLLDLGLAKLCEGADTVSPNQGLTTNQQIIGTAAYLSPEQARNPIGVDERTDVYSLGCSLIFLLTGRPPYEGASAIDTLLSHADSVDLDLDAIFKGLHVPTRLARLIGRMVAKEIQRRPQSMAEVLEELHRIGPESSFENQDSDARENTTRPSSQLKLQRYAAIALVILFVGVTIAIAVTSVTSHKAATEHLLTGVQFNGISSYGQVRDFDLPPDGTVMIDALVTPHQDSYPTNVVTWGGENVIALFIAPGRYWGLAVLDDGQSQLQVSLEPFEVNRTYRVTAKWENKQITLWVDGHPIATKSKDYALTPSNVSLCFGGIGEGLLPRSQGTRFFAGVIHRFSLHVGELPRSTQMLDDFTIKDPSIVLAFELDHRNESLLENNGATVRSVVGDYLADLSDCTW